MNTPSLADRAIETLAAVSAIDREVTNDDPSRHTVRSLKRIAEAVIESALRQAHDLAYQAAQLLADERERAAAAIGEKQ